MLDLQKVFHSSDNVIITVKMDPTGLISGLMLGVDVAAGVGPVQMHSWMAAITAVGSWADGGRAPPVISHDESS